MLVQNKVIFLFFIFWMLLLGYDILQAVNNVLLVYINNCSEYTKNRDGKCIPKLTFCWFMGGYYLMIHTTDHMCATTSVTELTKPLKIKWKFWSASSYVQMPHCEDIIILEAIKFQTQYLWLMNLVNWSDSTRTWQRRIRHEM